MKNQEAIDVLTLHKDGVKKHLDYMKNNKNQFLERDFSYQQKEFESLSAAISALEKQQKLEKYSKMFESTFDWGCNDHAKYLYSLAVYSVISGNENFKECEENFIEYIAESTSQIFSR